MPTFRRRNVSTVYKTGIDRFLVLLSCSRFTAHAARSPSRDARTFDGLVAAPTINARIEDINNYMLGNNEKILCRQVSDLFPYRYNARFIKNIMDIL